MEKKDGDGKGAEGEKYTFVKSRLSLLPFVAESLE